MWQNWRWRGRPSTELRSSFDATGGAPHKTTPMPENAVYIWFVMEAALRTVRQPSLGRLRLLAFPNCKGTRLVFASFDQVQQGHSQFQFKVVCKSDNHQPSWRKTNMGEWWYVYLYYFNSVRFKYTMYCKVPMHMFRSFMFVDFVGNKPATNSIATLLVINVETKTCSDWGGLRYS